MAMTLSARIPARKPLLRLADHPDLWLIDIGLPDGNGLDLYRELTAVRKVPAVFSDGQG